MVATGEASPEDSATFWQLPVQRWALVISGVSRIWLQSMAAEFSAGVYSFDSIFWLCIDHVGNVNRTYDEEEPGGGLFLLWQNGTI